MSQHINKKKINFSIIVLETLMLEKNILVHWRIKWRPIVQLVPNLS